MSSTIDKRVVEMKFDNRDFETNVRESMRTLDKLNSKIDKVAIGSSFQSMAAVANGISFAGLRNSIGDIADKFSVFGQIGMNVLRRVTDAAIDFGRSLTKYVMAPINQIVSGGITRALNLEQAHFQLEGLGVAWEDILSDIEYGVVDTAYGLDEAAKVASQLVASQVTIGDDMRAALRGISGVAAMTSSSYSEIGDIFTTIAGNGRMYTQNLYSFASRGLNVAAALADYLTEIGNGATVTEQQVREMVTKGQISFDLFSKAMDSAFGEHATRANETFTGAMSNVKAALSRIGADVATPALNNVRDILNAFRETVNGIRKVLGPFIETVVELMGSGTEKILGFLENVNHMFDLFANREDILNRFPQYLNVTDSAFANLLDTTRSTGRIFNITDQALLDLMDTSDRTTTAVTNLSDVVRAVIRGEYGSGQPRRDALAAAGFNYEEIQSQVNHVIYDFRDVEEGLASLEGQVVSTTGIIVEASGEIAANPLYSREDFDRLQNMIRIIDNLHTGFENIIQAGKNVWETFKKVGKALIDGFLAVFNADFSDTVVDITEAIKDFTESLIPTEEETEKLTSIFKGFFAAIDILYQVVVALADAFSPLLAVFGALGGGILDVGASAGESIFEFDQWLRESGKLYEVMAPLKELMYKVADGLIHIGDVIGPVIRVLGGLITKIGEFFKMVWNLPITQEIVKGVKDAFIQFGNWFSDKFSDLKGVVEDFIDSIGGIDNLDFDHFIELLGTIKDWFVNKLNLGGVIDQISSFRDQFSGLTGGFSSIFETITGFGDSFSGTFSGISDTISGIIGNITGFGDSFSNTFDGMSGSLNNFRDGSGLTLESIRNGFTDFIDFVKEHFNAIGILLGGAGIGAGAGIGGYLVWSRISELIGAYKSIIQSISTAIDNFSSAQATDNKVRLIQANSTAVLKIAIAIVGIGLTIYKLATVENPENLLTAAESLAIVLAALSLVLLELEHVPKITVRQTMTIALMVAVVNELSALVSVMTFLPNADAVLPIAASISLLLVAFAGAIWILSNSDVYALERLKSTSRVLSYMVEVVAAIALVIAAASWITNAQTAIPVAIAISILLEAFAGALWIISKSDVYTLSVLQEIKEVLILMGLITGLLGLTIGLVASMANPANAIVSAAAISLLLLAFAESMYILSNSNEFGLKRLQEAIPVLAAMAVIATALGGIIAIVAMFTDPLNAIAAATAVSILLLAFAGAMVIMGYASLSSAFLTAALPALATMIVITGLLAVMIGSLCQIPNVDKALEVSAALSLLLVTFTGCLTVLTIVGLLGLAALPAIAILAGVIAAFIGLSEHFGEYNQQQLETLRRGFSVMQEIAEAIGGFIAGIINTAINQVVDNLIVVAGKLEDFAEKLKPFLTAISQIDPDVMVSINTLTDMIRTLGATTFIDSLSQFLGFGGVQGFSQHFEEFGDALLRFSMKVRTIHNLEQVQDSADVLRVICGALSSAPISGGILDAIFGHLDVDSISESLPNLGESLKQYAQRVLTVYGWDKVAMSAEALVTLFKALKEAPNEGGLLGMIMGNQPYNELAGNIERFARALVKYSMIINQGPEDWTRVDASAEALVTLFKALKQAPNEGGLVGMIMGNQPYNELAGNLERFARALVSYATIIDTGPTNWTRVERSAEVLVTLFTALKEAPNEGGLLGMIVGNQDYSGLADNFEELGAALVAYDESIANIDPDRVASSASLLQAMSDITGIEAGDSFDSVVAMLRTFSDNSDAFSIVGSMEDFANGLIVFGDAFVDFSDSLSGVNYRNIDQFIEAVGNLYYLFAGKGYVAPGSKSMLGGSSEAVASVSKTFDEVIDEVHEDWTELETEMNAHADFWRDSDGGFIGMKPMPGEAQRGMERTARALRSKPVVDGMRNAGLVNGESVGQGAVDGLNSKAPSFNSAVSGLNAKVNSASNLNDAKNRARNLGEQVPAGMTSGINSRSKTVYDAEASLWNVNSKANNNDAYNRGSNLGSKIPEGVSAGINAAAYAVNKSTESLRAHVNTKTALNDAYARAKQVGSHINEGYGAGITEKAWLVEQKSKDLATKALNAAKVALGIKSPSKEFYKVGNFSVLGFINALSDGVSLAGQAGEDIAYTSLDSLFGIVNSINEDFDLNPVITPIVDLSNAKRGAQALNAMMSSVSARKIADSLAASEIQNGVNTAGENSTGGVTFIQNNYSPKALSRIEVYRQTKNQLSQLERVPK